MSKGIALQKMATLMKLAKPEVRHKYKDLHDRMSKMLSVGSLSPMAIMKAGRGAKWLAMANIAGTVGNLIVSRRAHKEEKANEEAREKFRTELLAKYGREQEQEDAMEKQKYEEARKDKEEDRKWQREKFDMSRAMHERDMAERRSEGERNRSHHMSLAKLKHAMAGRGGSERHSDDDDYKKESGGLSRGEMLKIASQKFKNPDDVRDYVLSHGKAKVKKESGSFLTKVPIAGKLFKMAGVKGNDSYTLDRELPKARK